MLISIVVIIYHVLCNKTSRQVNVLSKLLNVLNVDTKLVYLQIIIVSHIMYCSITV